jgi:ABC-2 type transport system ATP-binding protein
MNILELNSIVKNYNNVTAVDNVSFAIPEGTIFGMLGPNGAGKSSTIRIITTITRADSGTVLFRGVPLNSSHPEHIGYMPEERGLYKKMKIGEQLMYLARLKGMSYHDARTELIYWFEKFEIKDWFDKKVEELSKGMSQKAQFISTIMHKPKLLILDEPFSGLDPINANLIKDEIYELNKQGTTIIFSTHRMEQVEEICDQIVLINKGKNVLQGNVSQIKQDFKENIYKIASANAIPDALASQLNVIKNEGNDLILKMEGMDANTILKKFIEHGVQVQSFNEILPSLNEIFIKRVNETNPNSL